MNCPKCQHAHTAITCYRRAAERVQRERKCMKCDHRFTTLEVTNLGIDLLLRSIEANRIAGEAKVITQRTGRLVEHLDAMAKQLTPLGGPRTTDDGRRTTDH